MKDKLIHLRYYYSNQFYGAMCGRDGWDYSDNETWDTGAEGVNCEVCLNSRHLKTRNERPGQLEKDALANELRKLLWPFIEEYTFTKEQEEKFSNVYGVPLRVHFDRTLSIKKSIRDLAIEDKDA